MTSNDLTNRLLNMTIVVSVVLAIALYAYYEWQPADPGPPETLVPKVDLYTWSGCWDGTCYFCWNVGKENQECIQHGPGPVEPVPKIEDHVAAVTFSDEEELPELLLTMNEDGKLNIADLDYLDNDTIQRVLEKYCPTYDTLKRAGMEIVCTNAFGEVPSVNYWPVEVGMACSKIKKIVVTDKRIEVERR